MLASLRAELLVLRKWRAVWALLAAVPVYVLILWDLGSYVQYLTASPLQASLSPDLLEQRLGHRFAEPVRPAGGGRVQRNRAYRCDAPWSTRCRG